MRRELGLSRAEERVGTSEAELTGGSGRAAKGRTTVKRAEWRRAKGSERDGERRRRRTSEIDCQLESPSKSFGEREEARLRAEFLRRRSALSSHLTIALLLARVSAPNEMPSLSNARSPTLLPWSR